MVKMFGSNEIIQSIWLCLPGIISFHLKKKRKLRQVTNDATKKSSGSSIFCTNILRADNVTIIFVLTYGLYRETCCAAINRIAYDFITLRSVFGKNINI